MAPGAIRESLGIRRALPRVDVHGAGSEDVRNCRDPQGTHDTSGCRRIMSAVLAGGNTGNDPVRVVWQGARRGIEPDRIVELVQRTAVAAEPRPQGQEVLFQRRHDVRAVRVLGGCGRRGQDVRERSGVRRRLTAVGPPV